MPDPKAAPTLQLTSLGLVTELVPEIAKQTIAFRQQLIDRGAQTDEVRVLVVAFQKELISALVGASVVGDRMQAMAKLAIEMLGEKLPNFNEGENWRRA